MNASPLTLPASLVWLLGAGLLAARVARWLGVPDLVLFVLLGVVLGPGMLDRVNLPATGGVGQLIVIGGAVFMLYEGGRAVDLAVLRRIWPAVALLASLGVAVTAAVVAVASRLVLGVPWTVALLAGAVVAGTDPATIVPLFARLRVRSRLVQLVVAESAFNDATGAVFTMTVLLAITGGRVLAGPVAVDFARLVVLGAVVGVMVGSGVQALVAGDRRWGGFLTEREEVTTASLLAMALAYVVANALGGSGFMAVFVAGIVRGRIPVPPGAQHEAAHNEFLTLLGTVVRMLVFGVLGASVNLRLIGAMGPGGVAVVGVLLFVARPLAVFLTLPLHRAARWSGRELLFTAWVRETGVVPAALAGLLLGVRAPGADVVAALVFLAVVLTIAVQAPTTAAWAHRLAVSDPDGGGSVDRGRGQ